jgi:hypothetical protein
MVLDNAEFDWWEQPVYYRHVLYSHTIWSSYKIMEDDIAWNRRSCAYLPVLELVHQTVNNRTLLISIALIDDFTANRENFEKLFQQFRPGKSSLLNCKKIFLSLWSGSESGNCRKRNSGDYYRSSEQANRTSRTVSAGFILELLNRTVLAYRLVNQPHIPVLA